MHPENKETLALNLLAGGNSPDTKPTAVLALRLDMSALVIVSAPLPHFRWVGSVQDSQKVQPPFFCTWLDDGSESTGIRGHLDLSIEECTAQEKLKELIEVYEQGAGIKAMLSDLAEFLDERSMQGQKKYDAQEEKDKYLAELIQSDEAISNALNDALDSLGY